MLTTLFNVVDESGPECLLFCLPVAKLQRISQLKMEVLHTDKLVISY